MSAAVWTDDDGDAWTDARLRQLAGMSDVECRALLGRLAHWMSTDGARRQVWADEHWAATRQGSGASS